MDRGGNFLGTLTVPGGSRPFNLGPALLEAGLAKLHPSFDPDRVQGGSELAAAQEHAQKGKLKVRVYRLAEHLVFLESVSAHIVQSQDSLHNQVGCCAVSLLWGQHAKLHVQQLLMHAEITRSCTIVFK